MKKYNKYSILEKKNFKWIGLFLLPVLVIFAVFYVRPVCMMIYTSFTNWKGLGEPKFIGFKNYYLLFKNRDSVSAIKNLILWTLLAVFVHVPFGVLVAFVLQKKPFGYRLTRVVFMIPNIIAASAWAIIFRFIFKPDIGILNTIIRVFDKDFNVNWFYQMPYAFWGVAFTWLFFAVIITLIVTNDLTSIPAELMDAAKIDGATGWKIIRYIQLPLCRISIGTSCIVASSAIVSMYEMIDLTTGGGPGGATMSFGVLLVNALLNFNYGYANAIGILVFIIGLLELVIYNRLFRMNESVY